VPATPAMAGLRAAWLLAGLVAAAVSAAPVRAGPTPPALEPVEEVPTGRGRPRILLAPRAGEVAVLRVTFDVGSMDDGSSPGLTRLAQYALLEANRQVSPDELGREVWASGGRLEILTGQRTCAFVLVASRRDFGRLARRLLPALFAPRLDPDLLPAAVARAVLDVGEDHDLLTLLTGLGAEGRGWRTHPPHGRRAILESIELDEVSAHLARSFTPARAEVVVTGAFARSEVLPLLGRYRGGAPVALERLALDWGQERRPGAREYHLLAFPLRLPGAREAAAARVLAALIEDSLWRGLRGAGLAYSFDARVVHTRWLDALAVLVPAHASDGTDLGATIRGGIERIRAGRFADAELEQARDEVLADLAATDASPERLAEALAEGGTSWQGPTVAEAVAALRRAELLTPAQEWLYRSFHLYVGPQP
jgi:predicted Zn-dependent peptidase